MSLGGRKALVEADVMFADSSDGGSYVSRAICLEKKTLDIEAGPINMYGAIVVMWSLDDVDCGPCHVTSGVPDVNLDAIVSVRAG